MSYDVEMVNANPRTSGLVLQYRAGTSGAWTTVSGGVYAHNNTDRINGQVDHFNNVSLPVAAESHAILQLRWASWRGTETGNSSGIAIDNVCIAAELTGSNSNISASNAPRCGELFISEYLQDVSSMNKAIEIYNPTGAPKNLEGYYLHIETGANTGNYIALTGTVQPNQTHVIAHPQANSAILAQADQLENNLNYSGKNAISLIYSTNLLTSVVMIDKIGDGNVPTGNNGWPVSAMGGVGSTQNHTITRLMTLGRGNVQWDRGQFEWYSHPLNTFGFLGWHANACSSASMPTANLVIAPPPQVSIYADVQTSCNTQNVDYQWAINLNGFGWSNPINVYFNDYNYYTNYFSNPENCNNTPQASYNDWTYEGTFPGNNYLAFPADPNPPVNGDNLSFTIHLDCAGTDGDIISNGQNYVWGCFFVDVDPTLGTGFQAYDIGTTYQGQLYITDQDLNGIKSYYNSDLIKVHPNPVTDEFTIENKSQASIVKVIVTDMLGRDVISIFPTTSGPIKVRTETFAKGAYCVKVYNKTECFTVKLIKE